MQQGRSQEKTQREEPGMSSNNPQKGNIHPKVVVYILRIKEDLDRKKI